MPTNPVLLLGAGFSRNWGGWLASEVDEFLLGCPEVDDHLRAYLLAYRGKGGFEAALGNLQLERRQRGQSDRRLSALLDAISRMFKEMNEGFASISLPKNDMGFSAFMKRFNAIFTLNQDTLLETIYLDAQPQGQGLSERFSRAGTPGVRLRDQSAPQPASFTAEMEPDDAVPTTVDPTMQPYFKLHGSSNWRYRDGGDVMIVGGNKDSEIIRSPLLNWYFKQFHSCLTQPSTKLMVIGSFVNIWASDATTVERRRSAWNVVAPLMVSPAGT